MRGTGEKEEMNESEETEEIKHPHHHHHQNPYLLQGEQALPNYKPVSSRCPGHVRYTSPLPHPNEEHLLPWLSKMRLVKNGLNLRWARMSVPRDHKALK